jgi:alkyl hydroperoxide reductase subunit AhpF
MLTGVEYVRDICLKNKISVSTVEKNCEFSNGYLNPKKLSKIPYDRAVKLINFFNSLGIKADINLILNDISGTKKTLSNKDEKDISKKVDDILSQLNNDEALMFDGEPMNDETKELLRASLENSVRMAKITAKKKFTPKKYR